MWNQWNSEVIQSVNEAEIPQALQKEKKQRFRLSWANFQTTNSLIESTDETQWPEAEN